MADVGRLVTAWIDLDLALVHLQSAQRIDWVEASHWLRIAAINLGRGLEGEPTDSGIPINVTLRVITGLANGYDEAVFKSRGWRNVAENAIPQTITRLIPSLESPTRNLRLYISSLLHERPTI